MANEEKPLEELTLRELFEKMKEVATEMLENADKQVEHGNKTAALRSRRRSLELEKMLLVWRKASVEAAKGRS